MNWNLSSKKSGQENLRHNEKKDRSKSGLFFLHYNNRRQHNHHFFPKAETLLSIHTPNKAMNLMLPAETFKGKTMLITGGGSGLGFSMARAFQMLGAHVIIAGRKEERLRDAAAKLKSLTGKETEYHALDVRDAAGVESLVNQIFARFQNLDGLVNNAAGNFISPTERLSANAFSSIIDIVLKGSVHTTLAAGKNWIEKKQKGTVLNIATTYASTGSGFVVPSAVAKAGLVSLTRSLAAEWGRYGIRTNAIAPGPVPTEGAWSRLFPKEALPAGLAENMDPARKIPLGRVGTHEELVNLACFLLSDFSGFINGEVVTMDGGEWLQGAGEFNWLKDVPASMWDAIEAMTRKGK
jgi:NAD(P)-dependent dehydrogenase (short-subunit alcohol dehydrogenase family)